MAEFLYAILLFIIFMLVGFSLGFASAYTYYLINSRPVKRFQYTEPADQKAIIKREMPLDESLKKSVDGYNALSDYNI